MNRSEFGLIAEIDFLYFELRQFHERMQTPRPKAGIEMMIDNATGFADVRLESQRKEVRRIFKQILRRKKKLGLAVSDIEDFLELTKQAVPTTEPTMKSRTDLEANDPNSRHRQDQARGGSGLTRGGRGRRRLWDFTFMLEHCPADVR